MSNQNTFQTVAFPVRQYTRNKPSKYTALLTKVQNLGNSSEGIVIPTEYTDGRTGASVSSTLSKAAKKLGFDIKVAKLADGSFAVQSRASEDQIEVSQ